MYSAVKDVTQVTINITLFYRSVFSSTKSQTTPSTGQVLQELQRKTEKRKREDNGHDHTNDSHTAEILTVSPSQTFSTDSKRHKHDSGETAVQTEASADFVKPSPVLVDNSHSSQSSNVAARGGSNQPPQSAGVSPKRDGHLRTAIASSYSSSRRVKSKVFNYECQIMCVYYVLENTVYWIFR